MISLSVNINKFATLRNSRGGNNPNVLTAALRAQQFGADGITVHPRPDARHITFQDVIDIKQNITKEFNIEGNSLGEDKFTALVLQTLPTQVTLVPDAQHQLTSNKGWDTIAHKDYLTDIVSVFKEKGIRVSIFVNAELAMVEGAKEVAADRIELYTGPYYELYDVDRQRAIAPFVEAATRAREIGLGINAGHDLTLQNLGYFAQQIPWVDEVSIGHALVCDALYMGFENAIQMYKRQLK